LYTTVNFLHEGNVQLMGLILGKSLEQPLEREVVGSITSG
jgi:hypothetical protein